MKDIILFGKEGTFFLNFGFAAYFISAVCYAGRLFFKNKVLVFSSRVAMIHSIVAIAIYIVLRWTIAERPPLSNMFESLVLFSWIIGLAVLFTDSVYKIKILNPFITLVGLLILGYASFLDKGIAPLLPALKSNWLTIHVLTCFIGYAALTVAFVASIVYLLQNGKGPDQDPGTKEKLDVLTHKMISLGFLFLTLGIITGAVWANSAWGTYWSWDPKETWSLVTWFIYAGYLHLRLQKGWKGRKLAWVSILGFLAMLFTYFGVNYIMSGLHSYG